MNFELSHIAFLITLYLSALFGIAYAANKRLIPSRITNHPITYLLSLSIFFSAWTFYGVVDLAQKFGYGALAYYMGLGLLFLFAPMLQTPLAELCQRFQLRSIADLLMFRFNSQLVGSLATLCMVFALIPLMVLQIQSFSETLHIMTANTPLVESNIEAWLVQRDISSFFYCLMIATFCMIFGASYRQYQSVVTTLAFESLIKIITFIIIGLFAIYSIFGGFNALDNWLADNPQQWENLFHPVAQSSSHSLLLVFLSAGILMPHVFHMSHINMSTRDITRMVSWAFPGLLLLIAIPVFPILWAGIVLDVPHHPSYFTLGVPLQSGSFALTMMAYIGGVSAASGLFILFLLSLSNMISSHWVLPLFGLKTARDIYAQLRWLQRALILFLALIAYGAYLFVNRELYLVDLALMTFIQALQFLPGILAISYFPSANRYGFFAGILAGTGLWIFWIILPLFLNTTVVEFPITGWTFFIGISYWEKATILSLSANIICFVLVSRITSTSDEEHYHAELCAEDELSRPIRRSLDITIAREFKERLTESLGAHAAAQEVNRALHFLKLKESETRPSELRRLRTRIQSNLSSLMGQSVAVELMDRHFPFITPKQGKVLDINLMENRLDRMGDSIQGLTADVNQLRLHHRNTLQELPIAICSLSMDDEILLWNKAMTQLTQISDMDDMEITGSNIKDLPDPWGRLIHEFANSEEPHINQQASDLSGETRSYRFHKTALQESNSQHKEGQVIIIEDVTELQQLEQQLMHNTRLASIGQLAAGVAHEIGNPVTGIACLAQDLKFDDTAEAREETAEAILSQTDRISRIVQSLVTFAHSGHSAQKAFHKVAIRHCINEAIHLLSLQKDRKPIEYNNQAIDDIFVWGDTQRLTQVFINLLSNANDASPDFSTITLETLIKTNSVHIQITDEGVGIAQEDLDKIMDPFFTTKEAGKGTGLGLSVVFSVIEEHQGTVEVISPVAQNKGTQFIIKLPLYTETLETVSQPIQTMPS